MLAVIRDWIGGASGRLTRLRPKPVSSSTALQSADSTALVAAAPSDQTAPPRPEPEQSLLKRLALKRYGVWLLVFSTCANLLMLAVPVHMTQVYNNVIPSQSLDTLIYLTAVVAVALAVFGALETLRQRVAERLSNNFELMATAALTEEVITSTRSNPVQTRSDLADTKAVAQLLGSRGFIGLFDFPFAPVFVLLLFIIHPLIGFITMIGVVLLVGYAIVNALMVSQPHEEARVESFMANQKVSDTVARIEDVRALGMGRSQLQRWADNAVSARESMGQVNSVNSSFFGLVRFTRQLLQVILLSAGGYLVVKGGMSAGLILAASIIAGKALAPIEHLIGSWQQLVAGLAAWKRVYARLKTIDGESDSPIALPDLTGKILALNVGFTPPGDGEQKELLSKVSFAVDPGEILAVIGPSGAGKSTLIRLLAGVAPVTSGTLKYDGFEIHHWDPEQLGESLGYINQDINFFAGTIAENVSRFDQDAQDEAIIKAARLAGAHEFIGSFPDGYNTKLGSSGVRLSGGQRQRLALARAFYGEPRLLLLDEPDANLDANGVKALREALLNAKERGITVVLATHRMKLLDIADKQLTLKNGEVDYFGPLNLKVPGSMRLAGPAGRKKPAVQILPSVTATAATSDGAESSPSESSQPTQSSQAEIGSSRRKRLRRKAGNRD